ncbi:BTAD domain-containing putative transcriptional regulator [Longispora sp. K20-0274]|uniref:AfsR/SARP family transcriptional regulator n=1 Tax=Longispora sp. K20-0274 TaxID=3088255 RepID=UPI00399A0889
MIEYGVLGPVSVQRDGTQLDLGAPMMRRLLALLLCQDGQAISAEAIIDALWDGAPPPSARKTLQVYVMRLRRALGDSTAVRHTPAGYLLAAAQGAVDAHVFTRQCQLADSARNAHDLDAAHDWYQRALRLWRGAAYADMLDVPAVAPTAARLEELRMSVVEASLDIDVRLGRFDRLTAELPALIEAHPFRERLREYLMVALYQTGRQAEAQEIYQDAYAVFGRELGVEPGIGLRRLHEVILRGDPLPTEHLAAPDSTRQRFLPRAVSNFVGRATNLAQLDEMTVDGPAAVAVITGPGGVGKTALALQWASRTVERYPDGQLYVNLRGYDQGEAMQPIDALAHLLGCLGVPPKQVPVDVDDAAAMFRDRVADRRIAVILDNARTAAQVRPLLPGGADNTVIVTSRDRLSGLVATDGAARCPLPRLTDAEGLVLLGTLAGDARVHAEPDAARRLLDVCGGLPLAIRIAAVHLADQPALTIGGFAATLSLAGLSIEGDEDRAIVTVLRQSVRSLPAPARRAFALLGVLTGPDFTAQTVSALCDVEPSRAEALLDTLLAAHLIDAPTAGRYTMHDLVRQHAHSTLANPTEETARYLGYMRHMTQLANSRIHIDPAPVADPTLPAHLPAITDASQAMAWLQAEHLNVAAAIDLACSTKAYTVAADTALGLPQFCNAAGYMALLVSLFERVIGLTDGNIEPTTSLKLRNAIGVSYFTLGRYPRAATLLEECVRRRDALGDHLAAARSRTNLSLVYTAQGRYDSALVVAEAALDVLRREAEPVELARVLGFLRIRIYVETGQHDLARADLTAALPILRSDGTTIDLTRALNNIGHLCLKIGAHAEALTYLDEALLLSRTVNDRYLETIVRSSVSEARHGLGDHAVAIAMKREVLKILRDNKITAGLTENTLRLGQFHRDAGEVEEALVAFREAREHAEQLGEAHLRARAVAEAGTLTGDTETIKLAISLLWEVAPAEAERLAATTGHPLP